MTGMTPVLNMKSCPACDSKFVPKSAKHKYCSKECRTGKAPAPELEYTLTDVSNHLLTSGPCALSCGVSELKDGGPCLIVTVRTTSSTTTVALSPADASAWLAEFVQKVKAMQDAAK